MGGQAEATFEPNLELERLPDRCKECDVSCRLL
jgi:hypothetical protein